MCWVWKAPMWEEKAERSQVHWKQDIIEGVNKPDSAVSRNSQYAGVSSSRCFWRLPGQLKGLNHPVELLSLFKSRTALPQRCSSSYDSFRLFST